MKNALADRFRLKNSGYATSPARLTGSKLLTIHYFCIPSSNHMAGRRARLLRKSTLSATRFTADEEDAIQRALDNDDPTTLQTARELHGFAQLYNWDNGTDALFEVIRHPLCDRGTALAVYWLAEPEHAHDFATRDAVPKGYQDVYDLVLEIETGIQGGAFTHQDIGFPSSEVAETQIAKSGIPDVLWRGSPGPRLIPPFTPDSILRSLMTRERTWLEGQFELALTLMKQAGHPIKGKAEPGAIIQTIGRAAVAIREGAAIDKRRYPEYICSELLQQLWNEQLCRCGSWRWMMAEQSVAPYLMLMTADRQWMGRINDVKYVITPPSVWRSMFEASPANAGLSWDGQLLRRFEELRDGGVGRRVGAVPQEDIYPIDETWTVVE